MIVLYIVLLLLVATKITNNTNTGHYVAAYSIHTAYIICIQHSSTNTNTNTNTTITITSTITSTSTACVLRRLRTTTKI